MTNGEGQTLPAPEQIGDWFKLRFGEEFNPTDGQKEWVKQNWGRTDVDKEEWGAVLPPIVKEENGITYVLKHGHYGTWTSEEALTIKEWVYMLPLAEGL